MIGTRAAGGTPTGGGRRLALGIVRTLVLVLPLLWILLVAGWQCLSPQDTELVPLLAAAPAIACAGSGRRRCVLMGGVSAIVALIPLTSQHTGQEAAATRAGTCAAILAVVAACWLTSSRRVRLVRELERQRAVATAAQQVVLRPLPARLGGLTLAGGHLSATRGAELGGDLYEALGTAHGVRVVIGDVRGHGLAAIGTVAAVLGSFREAAHDEAELSGVLRRLERALDRHLRERALAEHPSGGAGEPDDPLAEEFVTVLLLEIRPDGETLALNCGHPWPHQLAAASSAGPSARQLSPGDALPPLGLFPLPDKLPVHTVAQLGPGDALVLHTDGAEDARDRAGAFFPLQPTLARAAREAALGPAGLVASVQSAVLAHSGGRLGDDVALLVLRHDRRGGTAPGRPRPVSHPV
ncbi:protein phosphatase [Streptomyces albus subsp. albus]|nr:protein phosphatase [Streptomyces albus subsp. albus]